MMENPGHPAAPPSPDLWKLNYGLVVEARTDTSSVAPGWFFGASGLSGETWSVLVGHAIPVSVSDVCEPPAGVVYTEDLWREIGEFKPRTSLGRKLREARQRILASGAPLLDRAAIQQEIATRRGERDAGFK